MAAITAAQMVTMVDKAAAYWLAVLGSDAVGCGLGTTTSTAGGYKKADELEGIVEALQDYDVTQYVAAALRSMRDASDAYRAVAVLASGLIGSLDALCGAAGISTVSNLDSFATYYNLTTGTKWQCLFPPPFRELYIVLTGGPPTATNVYSEVLQGATYTNGLGKLVIGTGFTSGVSIDSTKYAGGAGQIVASSVTGSDTLTVAGTYRKPDGTTATGNGTATISGNGTVALTPPFTDALLISVSNITAGAGLTAGTFYVEAKRPSGRTNPPT